MKRPLPRALLALLVGWHLTGLVELTALAPTLTRQGKVGCWGLGSPPGAGKGQSSTLPSMGIKGWDLGVGTGGQPP